MASEILATLSQRLTARYGKGYTYTAVTRMMKVARFYSGEEMFASQGDCPHAFWNFANPLNAAMFHLPTHRLSPPVELSFDKPLVRQNSNEFGFALS